MDLSLENTQKRKIHRKGKNMTQKKNSSDIHSTLPSVHSITVFTLNCNNNNNNNNAAHDSSQNTRKEQTDKRNKQTN